MAALTSEELWDLWGSSHEWSSAITGASAEILAVPGYRVPDDPNAFAAARALLEALQNSPRSRKKLWHGRPLERIPRLEEHVSLPLTATTTWKSEALRLSAQGDTQAIFTFPAGTRALRYSDLEWIVAGRFVVRKVRREIDPYWETPIVVVQLDCDAPSMDLVALSTPEYVLDAQHTPDLLTLIEVVRARCASDPSWSHERKNICEKRLLEPAYGLTKYPLWRLTSLPVPSVAHDPAVNDDHSTEEYVRQRRSGSPFPPILALPSRKHPGTWWAHDGNHRVAAAKIVGDRFIDAYIPVEERAPPQRTRR